MAAESLCQNATPSPGVTPSAISRWARLVAAWSNSTHVNVWSGALGAKSMYADLSGVDAPFCATRADRVVSDHQPAARYCAASALVTAAPSTPIGRSYGRPRRRLRRIWQLYPQRQDTAMLTPGHPGR